MGEVTADGDIIVGRIRPKNNPLIHRSEVGRPAFHNDLPPLPPNYTFGSRMKTDAEGAGDVMLTWQVHCPPEKKQNYDFGRDFIALNRQSVKGHCFNAKQVSGYRKTHDARIRPKAHIAAAASGPSPSPTLQAGSLSGLPEEARYGRKAHLLTVPAHILNNPLYTYGRHSEESEGVADLIQNRYELQWVTEQWKLQQAIDKKHKNEKRRKLHLAKQFENKRKNLREKVAVTPQPSEFFTMERFRDVPPRYMTPTPTPFGK